MCFWESRRTTNDGMFTTYRNDLKTMSSNATELLEPGREREAHTRLPHVGFDQHVPSGQWLALVVCQDRSQDSDYQEQVCLLRH